MLKMTVPTTKRIPITILGFQWKSPTVLLKTEPCKLCKNHIGDNRWGLAWIKKSNKEFSGRLCEQCGKIAELEKQSEK